MYQICNDTDLNPLVKQQRIKQSGRGAFCAIHISLPEHNHNNAAVSEAEAILHTSTYNDERKYKTGIKMYPAMLSNILSSKILGNMGTKT